MTMCNPGDNVQFMWVGLYWEYCLQTKERLNWDLLLPKKKQILEIFHPLLFSYAKEHNLASKDRFCSQRKTFTQHLELAAPHPRLPISF